MDKQTLRHSKYLALCSSDWESYTDLTWECKWWLNFPFWSNYPFNVNILEK